MAALARIDVEVDAAGLDLSGCYLSVDSAYAVGWFARHVEKLQLRLVSEIRSNWIVWGSLWGQVNAGTYLALHYLGHCSELKPMDDEKGVSYQRIHVNSWRLGKLLITRLMIGAECKELFTTDINMKSKTMRRVARRRWQPERVFWSLKQLLGFGTIHQHHRRRVLVRVYLNFLLFQAAKDTSADVESTLDHMCQILRHAAPDLLAEIESQCASVPGDPRGAARLAEIET